MTTRRPCPPAPGPLEVYAARFDPLLGSLAQRRGLRDYLQGLLLPRDRNKTLTALADAEPITGAQHRQVQRLQWFVSESTWDHQAVNQQRIELLCADAATAPEFGSCWRSSPARAPGRRPRPRTPPWRPPASSAGVAHARPASGGGSPAASVTATPRPGGPLTRCWAAGGRRGRTGWWWPPPTRPGCRS